MEQEIATQVVGLGGSSDFSLWKLFLRADFVVKFVIILLIASSIFVLVNRRIKGTLYSLSGFSKLINYNLLGVLYSNEPNLNEKKLKYIFEKDIDLLSKENRFVFLGKKDQRNYS